MLPVEDWEKAGPTQPNTIERKKRNSFGNSFQLAKDRHGAKGPESADPREDFSISLLSKEPFSGRDVDNLFPARPGPGPSHRVRCKRARCDRAEPNATPKAAAFR